MLLDGNGPFYTANALLSAIGAHVRFHEGGDGREGADVVVENMELVALPKGIQERGERLPLVYSKRTGGGRALVVTPGQYFSQEWMGPAFNNPDERQKVFYELEYYLFEDLLK